MIENIIWGISFVTLYVAFVWINFLYLDLTKKSEKQGEYLSIDIAIPAYNEEKFLGRNIESLENMDYPKEKLRIIIIDDGSKDNTSGVAEEYMRKFDNIKLIKKVNGGKASAMNSALKESNSELFACVDADSYVEKTSLKKMMSHFKEEDVGAVISAIKVHNPKNVFEYVQRIEYIMAALSRKIRASINTLAMTPGVLSVYKTDILKKIGGFDENNITEDFEIAMNLKKNGYNVRIEPESFTYTKVPSNIKQLFRQRVRWYRGYLFNHYKYRDMFFNKKYGVFAYFQLPLNIIYIPIMLIAIAIVTYGITTYVVEFFSRTILIKGYFMSLFALPSFKEVILAQNLKILFPIWIGALVGIYMFLVAHKQLKEKIFFPASIWIYFVCFPFLVSIYWITAITQEIFRTKRKW